MKNSIPWISLGISLIALIFTLSVVIPTGNNTGNHNDIIGIIISAVALVVSLFFIVLGIRGHEIQKEINSASKEFESTVNTSIKQPAKQVSETFYDLYSRAIEVLSCIDNNLPKESGATVNKEYLDKLKMSQARFACANDFVDEKKKIVSIALLRRKSNDISDVDLLKKVISDSRNSDIRDAATEAVIEIKDKIRGLKKDSIA